jgi:hypothetical protein
MIKVVLLDFAGVGACTPWLREIRGESVENVIGGCHWHLLDGRIARYCECTIVHVLTFEQLAWN